MSLVMYDTAASASQLRMCDTLPLALPQLLQRSALRPQALS